MTDDLRDDDAAVAAALRSRPDAALPPGFADRLAARLEEERGWIGLADWRAWTFRFAPAAAALLAVAALVAGRTDDEPPSLSAVAESWAAGDGDGRPATSVLWQPEVSADSLLQMILTAGPDDVVDEGSAESPGGVK